MDASLREWVMDAFMTPYTVGAETGEYRVRVGVNRSYCECRKKPSPKPCAPTTASRCRLDSSVGWVYGCTDRLGMHKKMFIDDDGIVRAVFCAWSHGVSLWGRFNQSR